MPSPARVPVPETTTAAAASPPPRSATPAFRRWAIAVTVYIAAVFNRTSLGVAGLQAARRLGISPAQLSVFVLVQLGVYAAMQVPTGLLVDRYGPRRLLVAAAATMAVAQLAFALTRSYPEALLARGLLGCGDALTFVSVVRIAAQDFPRRRFPLAVSVTSMLGMAGNLAATIPLALLLRSAGWTVSFAGTGLVTLVTGVAVLILLPAGRAAAARQPAPAGRTLHRVRAAWRTPGTRLGFWVHFSCMSLATMFAVLWGLPYLVRQGFTEAGASAVLLVCVLAAIVASPAIGAIFGRYPAARVPFALSVCLLTVAGWGLLLGGFGGRPPHLLIVAVVAVAAVGGPASTIGFSLARDYNPPAMVGTATGVVNVGGFTSTIIASLLVGGVLELTGPGSGAGYRLAFCAAVAVQVLGTAMAVRWWLRVRGMLLGAQSRGEPVPVPVIHRQFDRVRPGPVG
jgi:MFS family permease